MTRVDDEDAPEETGAADEADEPTSPPEEESDQDQDQDQGQDQDQDQGSQPRSTEPEPKPKKAKKSRKAKKKAKARAKAASEPEPEPEPDSDSEPEPEAKTETDAETETATDTGRPPGPKSTRARIGTYLRSRGCTRLEVGIAILLGLAILVPGIWAYTLVDPWETHYAEVGRRMLQDDDLVHLQWQNEGFRSKPALTPWLIAGGLRSVGLAKDGGYSGEMVSSKLVMFGARLPFVLFGVFGVVMLWWMLASLVNRRVAWLAYLIVLTTPFYFFIARQSITDMPLVGCMMGALACFAMAIDRDEERVRPIVWRLTSYHFFLAAFGLFVGWQILYYGYYFAKYPALAFGIRVWKPHVLLPTVMTGGLFLFALWSWVFRYALFEILVTIAVAAVVSGVLTGLFSVMPAVGLGVGLALGIGAGVGLRLLFGIRPGMWRWWWEPPTTKRQVYMYWFYMLLGISVLSKGIPGVGLAGAICFFYVLLTGQWRMLAKLEIPRGIFILVLVAVPWHVAMWLKDGRRFLQEYLITHNLRRATAGVHGERGTFDFFIAQLGIGMWPWVALVPAAVAGAVTNILPGTREGRVRLLVGVWAITSVALFSAVQTKFHHYIFPAVPALAALIAFWLDDLLALRIRRIALVAIGGAAIVLLIMRDLMGEQKQFIELFVYRYDRPWPSGEPWNVDLSGTIFGFGIVFALVILILAVRRIRWITVGLLGACTLVFAFWAMNDYMDHAATHWGQRSAIRTYYQQRQIHGIDIRYYGLRQLSDEWSGFGGEYKVESFIPDTLAVGQKMTVKIELMKPDQRTVEKTISLSGEVSRVGDARFWIQIPADETAKLAKLVEEGRNYPHPRRKPWKMVNADRLIAWQLYWRGENFWSGDEIWAESPDTKTAFKQTDNKEFLKYLNERGVSGQRYFVVTEAGRANGLRNILPTARAKDTFEILDRTCNKFTLLSFTL